jgi:hypothetical protein
MLIVLDTNIFLQDISLKSAKSRVLKDFLRKSDSHVVLPEIIELELLAHLERELSRQYDIAKRALGWVKDLSSLHIPPLPKLDVRQAAHDRLHSISRALRVAYTRNIAPIRGEYLREVIRRAVRRERPCSDRGEEMRDAVIWLGLLDLRANVDRIHVAFISANTKQFADENGRLHPDLEGEADQRGVEVHYYPGLDEFIKDHATKGTYITTNWLKRHLPEGKIAGFAKEEYRARFWPDFRDWVREESPRATGKFEIKRVNASLVDYWVYRLADQSLELRGFYQTTVVLDVELAPEAASITAAGTEPMLAGNHYKEHYLSVQAKVSAQIVSRKVTKTEITEIELAY